MAVDFALKAVRFGSCGSHGSRIPARRVGAAEVFSFGRERVRICGGSNYGGTSLRLSHVACSDSSPAPAQPKRKKKSKLDGPTKTEQKLLRELREFIASWDLPPNEVPTTAELARNGRQDLANQVRRRGYKLVAQLLQQVRTADNCENTQSEDVTVTPNGSLVSNGSGNDAVEFSSAKLNGTASNDVQEPNNVRSSNGGGFEGSLSDQFPTKDATLNGHASREENVVEQAVGDQMAVVPVVGSDHWIAGEAAGVFVSEEFIQDSIQDSATGGPSQPVNLVQDVTNEGRLDESIEEGYEGDDLSDAGDDEEYYEDEDEDDDDDSVQIPVLPDPQSPLPEDIATQKASLLRARLQEYFSSRSMDVKRPNSFLEADMSKEKVATQHVQDLFSPEDVLSLATKKSETQKELEQVKDLLHSRELDLAEISRQLEEAKGMLALARAKATAELVHVKQLAVEQDVRLQTAEQALADMKQVHLEWWGEGSQVEVTGSFNGWQHSFLLEPDFSSEIPKPDGARGPMMWGAYLCLYPGVYEIKFIVDGNWQVDHRRELVTRHSLQNNILRVE